jgi:GxxExxY protein
MQNEQLTYEIRAAMFAVFKELGPGLLERIYKKALLKELVLRDINVKEELSVPVFYKGEDLDVGFRVDLLVENEVVIEIKSVESLHDVHRKQLLTYLKLLDKRVGILVNFNDSILKDHRSIIRIVN